MAVVLTPSAEHLDLPGDTLAPHPQNDIRQFPDGEAYVQLPDVEKYDEATVVHSGMPDPNTGLQYLFGVLDLLKQHDVPTTVCFTYMPYGMQDAAFFDGNANRARSLLEVLTEYYDVDTVYTVDAHFAHRDWISAYPIENLHVFPEIDNYVAMNDYVVVGPDQGAVDRFGIPGFNKKRNGVSTVDVSGDLDVEGKNVVVFDDIIETGSTMVTTHNVLKNQGADRVVAAAAHGVLNGGVERVRTTYDQLYLANTIDTPHVNVSLEPVLRDKVF